MSDAPPGNTANRWFLLAAACLQNALCTGLLFGFAALQPALQEIDAGEGGSTDLGWVFTLAVGVNMFAPLLLAGPLLDALGPRACSCTCTCLIGAGFLLFGVSPYLPGRSMPYFLPAMLLIGLGGPGCQCCLFHTANLFQARAMALNLITAFIGPSFVIFEMLVGLSSWFDISLQQAFLLYCSLPFACMVVSAMFMADVPFSSDAAFGSSKGGVESFANNMAAFDKQMSRAEVTGCKRLAALEERRNVRVISLGAARPIVFIKRKKTTHKQLRPSVDEELHEPFLDRSSQYVRERFPVHHQPKMVANSGEVGGLSPGSSDDIHKDQKLELIGAPLFDQLRSFAFAELTLFFGVSSLFFQFFCGSMQEQAEAALHAYSTREWNASKAAANCVSTYLSLAPLSALLNPFLGYCIDHHGFRPMLTVTLLAGAGHAFALRFGAFYVSAAIFSVFQACCFSYMFSYLAFEFGFEYYGLLAGVIQFLASIATLTFQPCLRSVAATHGWPEVQLIQAVSFGLLALWIVSTRLARWIIRSRRDQRRAQATTGRGTVAPSSPAETGAGKKDERSYSDGDLHTSPVDQTCRRRADYFPNADDILVIDGANPHYSRAAYQLGSEKERLTGAPPEAV